MSDILERLREESLRLARNSFDSVDAGLAANVADAAIDEIERLRDALSKTIAYCDSAMHQTPNYQQYRDERPGFIALSPHDDRSAAK
jgi:hypothetical protein